MTDYFILDQVIDPHYCAIYDLPQDMPKIHYPVDGIPLGESGYEHVFDMASEEPGIAVADVINNALGYTLISARMKAFLEQESTAEIEYTPFKLRNHKGRTIDDELYIANVIGTVDCVDLDKTEGREDPVNPGRFMKITMLALDEQRIGPALNLFRLAIRPKYLVVRQDLKEKMEAAGMTGTKFHRVGDKVKLR